MDNSFLGKLATRAVQALGIRDGTLVEIRADAAAYDWAEAMALSVEMAGGIPFYNVFSVQHLRESILCLPIDRLSTPPPLLMEMARRVEAMIVIERDWSELSRTCPPDKFAAWIKGMGAIVQEFERRGVADCQIAHPNAVSKEYLLVSRRELRRNLELALVADSDRIQARAEIVAMRLAQHERIEIISGSNHRLTLQFAGRPIGRGDGKLRNDCVINFPCGSVYVPPIEASVEGSIYFESWRNVKGLLLSFKNGRLSELKADRNAEQFESLLAIHTGDKDRVSHVGIGLNPGMNVYTGHIAVDECRAGSVFMALGENRYLGGTNASTLNVDFVSHAATLLDSDGVLVNNGKLMVADVC